MLPANEQARKMLLCLRRDTARRILPQLQREERELREGGASEPDWLDQAANQEAALVLATLGEAEQRELGEIDAALARINQDRYGTCERCLGPIGRGRLQAVPEARLCIDCMGRAKRR